MARKRKYLVMPRNTRTMEQGLVTGKGKLSFKGKSAMMINDPALANELDTQHGLKGTGDVWVHEDERAGNWEMNDRDDKKMGGVHNYTFQGVDAPWRKKKWKPQDDPEWEEVSPGRWRKVKKEEEEEDDG